MAQGSGAGGREKIDFKLYLITDRKLFPDRALFFAAVEAALIAGVRALQLREKDLPANELLELAYGMRALTSKYGAKLFINDRIDVALCSGADGVHLGRDGVPVYAAVKLCGGRLSTGFSAHSLQEACSAEKEGADFVTLGPLYRTPSKMKYGPPVGLAVLREVAERSCIPVFGIGGIKPDAVREVMGCGASGIAVISGILGQIDAKTAVGDYKRKLGDRL